MFPNYLKTKKPFLLSFGCTAYLYILGIVGLAKGLMKNHQKNDSF